MEARLDQVATTEPRGFVRREIAAFWAWYERNYTLNITIAMVLFGFQLLHLAWLGLDVIATRLGGASYFPASGVLLGALVIVDMFEIPALFSVSLVYVHEIRRKPNLRSFLFLFLLNSQWLHILWITDEFVVDGFANAGRAWPLWLAWVAIGIDYLELPVMYDTAKRALGSLLGDGSLREVFGTDEDSTAVEHEAFLRQIADAPLEQASAVEDTEPTRRP